VDISNGCGLCYAKQDLVDLAGDVDAAPDDVVALLAGEVSDHWSPEQWQWLIRRFTPRLLALVRERKVDVDRALRVYGPFYAHLATWPDDERRAVEEALHAALIDALEHWPTYDLVKMLGGLGSVYDDLGPWLAQVDAASGPAARGGVIRLAFQWADDLICGENDFFGWWYPDDPASLVREWTLNARALVEQFSQEHPTCKNARDAVRAMDYLDRGEDRPWLYFGHHGTLRYIPLDPRSR